jgi:hypothetical protein
MAMVAMSATLTMAMGLTSCGGVSEPSTDGAPPGIRRLTEAQYRNIIADVFGPEISVAARFDAPERVDGLLQIGTTKAAITPSAFERYDQLARSIAAQVMNPANRRLLVPCTPHSETEADAACARMFLTTVGRYLYRRPLTTKEIESRVQVAEAATRIYGNFYAGLGASLASMLEAPAFLYVADSTEPDPRRAGHVRLTGYARASRLSFLLWNTAPDEELLTAAERGELSGPRGVERQVTRLLASPRFETGVRAFFSDMLGFDAFDTLAKDSIIYPAFSRAVGEDAKEQTLRTLVALLVDEQADYREVFVTRKTFMTGSLGLVYRVPAEIPTGWVPFEFPQSDERAGILSQLSFVALHSHPGLSSPTQRGRAVRELLLCQKIPDPPGNVNFDAFNDPRSPHKTARQRLTAHSTQASCAGCHKLTDPIGLALENFDGAGQFRLTENGERIDTHGDLNGKAFTDAISLGRAMHDDPAATACLVSRAYSYAAQHAPTRGEREWMVYLNREFARDGFRLPALFKRIATSEALYSVTAPPPTAPPPAPSAVAASAGALPSNKDES